MRNGYPEIPLIIFLTVLATGLVGCNSGTPPPPPNTRDNALHIPAQDYNKIQGMGPRQREVIMQQMQKTRGVPSNAAATPAAGQ